MENLEDRLHILVVCCASYSLCLSDNAQEPHFDHCWCERCPKTHCRYAHIQIAKILHLFLDANVTWGFDIYSEYSDTQMSKSVLIFMFQLRSQQSWEHIVINMLLSYNAMFPFIESLPASTSLCCLLFGTTLLSVSSCPVIRAYNILIRVVFSFYY